MNDGVSLNISMILAVAFDGFLGAGPPPVFLCSFPKSENSFFAVEVKFFHLSRTSWAVRYAPPTAFTASVISSHAVFFFALVTLLENLDRIRSRFSSTFFCQHGYLRVGPISFAWPLLFSFLHLRNCSDTGRHIENNHISHKEELHYGIIISD